MDVPYMYFSFVIVKLPDCCVQGVGLLVKVFCYFQIPEDTQVEVGSAILECLQKDLPETTGNVLLYTSWYMCLYVQCTQQVMYCCTLILYMCLVYRLTVHTLVVYHCTLEYVYRCTVCTTSTVLVHVYIDVQCSYIHKKLIFR